MIAIVVPVHNEEALLPRCLASLATARLDPALKGEPVTLVVVLDSCTDGSATIVADHGAHVVNSTAKNVGIARAIGAKKALSMGARWLAFTDGDSEVPRDWLSRQLAVETDAVCGIVSIRDWSAHPPIVKRRYLARYNARDGHRHVHGANLGVSASAYEKVGGFAPISVHEDVAIIEALEAAGASVAWVARPCVVTNARAESRVAGGFATYLNLLSSPAELAFS